MGYSLNPASANCYEGTTCLINKFDIHDENQLSAVEAGITFAKASALEQQPIEGDFDFKHYKAIHKYLFEDLYEWAGQVRTINISKKGTAFANVAEINELADNCFERLKAKNYFCDLPFEEFVDNITDFYCVTNMLHPFREGNGRTQRVFITQLIRHAGYEIDFAEIDPDELMIATIRAANGVTDGLRALLEEHIFRGQEIIQSM